MQILRLPQVLIRRGKGRSAHYQDIARGLFTKPVLIGERAVGWPDGEVNALIAAQIAGKSPEAIKCLVGELEARRKKIETQQ